jgi:Protein of unknown function (DUF3489)
MSSAPKLTDTQQLILFAASQREDRCLVIPKSLKGGTAHKVATKLLTIGYVREIKAKLEAPIWRRDEGADQPFSLKLTAAGLKAMAVGAVLEARHTAIVESFPHEAKDTPKETKQATVALKAILALSPTSQSVRQGTKIAQVLDLLQRDQGARLDELTLMTGWLPHTARAALTGLRHRGFAVRLERGNDGAASVYRATAAPVSIAS